MEDITDEIKDLQEKVSSKFDNSNENLPSNQITNDTKKEIFGQPFGEKIQVCLNYKLGLDEIKIMY